MLFNFFRLLINQNSPVNRIEIKKLHHPEIDAIINCDLNEFMCKLLVQYSFLRNMLVTIHIPLAWSESSSDL